MVYTYAGIIRVLWGSLPSERIMPSSQMSYSYGDESHNNSLINPSKSSNLIVQENRQKAAKMLICVVIIFTICYIPVHVFNLFR
jgi:hypothetical protein